MRILREAPFANHRGGPGKLLRKNEQETFHLICFLGTRPLPTRLML